MTTGTSGVAPGQLPQSQVLAEATTDSLSVLLSRDPEGYSSQDLAQVKAALRAQRARWQASEAEKPARQPKASKLALASAAKAEDLGF